jgi:5-methylcytosine-specific restriction endonuclease McrA
MPCKLCLDCGRLALNSRCDKCEAQRKKVRRPSAYERGYNTEYYQNRAILLAGHPKCAECGSTSRLEIDHIRAAHKGIDNSLSNLRVLCRDCNVGKSGH